jgi:hypothetical protein
MVSKFKGKSGAWSELDPHVSHPEPDEEAV